MTARQKGYEFAAGACMYLAKLAMWVALVGWFVRVVFTFTVKTNDSDYSRWQRSGLEVHRDAKTGVEYLSTPGGGLIKREGVR